MTEALTIPATVDPGFAIRFLDAGNALPGIRALKPLMTEQLTLRRGMRVLELGCGAGDDARAFARRVGAGGHVLGIDSSPALVAEATRRSRGRDLPVEFRVGDALALDLPDGSFDRVRIERLLMHVDGEPSQVLAEAHRVLAPGGRIVVFDFDWDALAIDGAERELTRRIVRSYSDGIPNGLVGRALPRLLAAAGFEAVAAVPHGVTLPYDVFSWLVSSHLDAALAAGDFTPQQLIAWWDQLDRAHADGGFFAALLGFVAAGVKPVAGAGGTRSAGAADAAGERDGERG
jgi:ubiquinone/menaquinone biosynthesis C-methylase UbiE